MNSPSRARNIVLSFISARGAAGGREEVHGVRNEKKEKKNADNTNRVCHVPSTDLYVFPPGRYCAFAYPFVPIQTELSDSYSAQSSSFSST